MAVLGVRCWSDRFSYVVVSGDLTSVTLIDAKHIALPVNLGRGAQLASFRRDISDLLSQHTLDHAFFRAPEPISPSKDIHRSELEGVLQEACFSSDPSVLIKGRTVSMLKASLKYTGPANNVFSLFVRPEFKGLAKVKFADAAVTALSGLV
jgi:hypothetical protein